MDAAQLVGHDVLHIQGGRPVRGSLLVPGDKSISHRAVMLGALAKGESFLRGLSEGDDVARTLNAVTSIGAEVCVTKTGLSIKGGQHRLHEPDEVVYLGNSGTSMRLLTGLLAGFKWFSILQGDSSLSNRPMDRVIEPLKKMGAVIYGRGDNRFPPLAIKGGDLDGIDYTLQIPSAQVKSAILLAGLRAKGNTRVTELVPTRAHTEELLKLFGADIRVENLANSDLPKFGGNVIHIAPSFLHPVDIDIPADPSQGAFWVVAGCIVPQSEVLVSNLYSSRDRLGFVDVLLGMKASIELDDENCHSVNIKASHSAMCGTEILGDQIVSVIDEIPILAVAACFAEGTTVFRDLGELRLKESDRIESIYQMLRAFGVQVEVGEDELLVVGGMPLSADVTVDSFGDHRIAMAAAVAGLAREGSTEIKGWSAVNTSYKGFVRDLNSLIQPMSFDG